MKSTLFNLIFFKLTFYHIIFGLNLFVQILGSLIKFWTRHIKILPKNLPHSLLLYLIHNNKRYMNAKCANTHVNCVVKFSWLNIVRTINLPWRTMLRTSRSIVVYIKHFHHPIHFYVILRLRPSTSTLIWYGRRRQAGHRIVQIFYY